MTESGSFPALDPSLTYEQLFIELLKNLPEDLCVTLRVGALPHYLDEGLAEVLFPADPAGNLRRVASFPFVSETGSGRYEYHESTRRTLLDNWLADDPQEFRRLNGRLAAEYMRRLEAGTSGTIQVAMEWAYHAVAADPEAGMRWMANLFHELLETRELGAAERLVRLVREQQAWLGEQAIWLDYFKIALAVYRYQEVDEKALADLAENKPGGALQGCALRLLGRLAIQKRQWAAGRKYLQQALAIFKSLGLQEEQALTHLELGNRFYNQVASSGSVRAEAQFHADFLGNLLYTISRLPLLIYRWLAERFNSLPNLYGGSYQNLVALSLLRRSGRHYQAAGRLFHALGNPRGELETDFYMGRILLVLGYFDSAAKRCSAALQSPLARSSPYYTARLNLILGRTHLQHERLDEARKLLEECLETFTQYGDWRLTLEAALALGTVLEQQADWPALIERTAQGLEAAWHTSDTLAETRLASRLEWYIEMPGPGQAERQAAQKLRDTVTCLAYIDRFPGSVRGAFHALANWLAFPFAFLFVLTLILASGFLMQFIEGELRVQSDPVQWSQVLGLVTYLALPVLMLWGYYIFSILLGQVVALVLSLSKVDQVQPETWRLVETGLIKEGEPGTDNIECHLPWEDVRKLVVHNRALYSQPMMFSSRMYVLPASDQGYRYLELPASIFRYRSLQSELEKHLAGRVTKVELSILNTRWLWVALLVGFAVATAGGLGLFGAPWHACYNDPLVKTPQDICRPEFRVYIQPVVQAGLLFAGLLFGLVTWLRWQIANRKVRRELAS